MSVADERGAALRLHITGIVQGVGFRPLVFRLAQEHGITGWVRNGADGVHVAAEGPCAALAAFVDALRAQPPPAAHVLGFDAVPAVPKGLTGFVILASDDREAPTVAVSPDLAVCDDCVRELFDPCDRRFGYPYITCTNCGPRYSIVTGLPYDRSNTVMRDWTLCSDCRREYEDPRDRRFHAQPIACPVCGPAVHLDEGRTVTASAGDAIARAAALLGHGAIVAVKGIGGYHLACDAANAAAVETLRARKYRKERPFAVVARDLATAHALVVLDGAAEARLASPQRPIVLAPARVALAGVAPHNRSLGVMLPYTPVQHLLFAAGAPAVLVMTSANRSSEPIAYVDDDALTSLAGIADALLVGERPIARRVDDTVVRSSSAGCVVIRRSRGLAPQAVAAFPDGPPILAVGGDLKNALTLVVRGQAFASQHVGDLDHLSVAEAFEATARDLCAMYDVRPEELVVACDPHPGYRSRAFAETLPGRRVVGVQHHRAHVASVLAERGAWDVEVVAFAFDGTGYGDDGSIWGGEVFTGSLARGLARTAHLRAVPLAGGDAAARFPVQTAAGFLHDAEIADALDAPPFAFPVRYRRAQELIARNVRVFPTTSVGRLFDAVAAVVGFTTEQSFEGEAAAWLEHLAWTSRRVAAYDFPFRDGTFDPRPLLHAVVDDRRKGRAPAAIARAFHLAVAEAILACANRSPALPVIVTGGVFQNALLFELLSAALGARLWFNRLVPPNDGGLSLGQAAFAAV